jgi:hypothetical protein
VVVAWDKSASRRARGWAGENVAHNGDHTSHLAGYGQRVGNRLSDAWALLQERGIKNWTALVGRLARLARPAYLACLASRSLAALVRT